MHSRRSPEPKAESPKNDNQVTRCCKVYEDSWDGKPDERVAPPTKTVAPESNHRVTPATTRKKRGRKTKSRVTKESPQRLANPQLITVPTIARQRAGSLLCAIQKTNRVSGHDYDDVA